MCMAKPIIVSDHVGCAANLVNPGENGWIFPAGDVTALTECLQDALQADDRLIQFGQASKRKIQHYSYRQTTDGLQKALNWINPLSTPSSTADTEQKLYIWQSYSSS
jgi:glycosyltransferase involved in cell wall biosynthesis